MRIALILLGSEWIKHVRFHYAIIFLEQWYKRTDWKRQEGRHRGEMERDSLKGYKDEEFVYTTETASTILHLANKHSWNAHNIHSCENASQLVNIAGILNVFWIDFGNQQTIRFLCYTHCAINYREMPLHTFAISGFTDSLIAWLLRIVPHCFIKFLELAYSCAL